MHEVSRRRRPDDRCRARRRPLDGFLPRLSQAEGGVDRLPGLPLLIWTVGDLLSYRPSLERAQRSQVAAIPNITLFVSPRKTGSLPELRFGNPASARSARPVAD